ncbi:MAG TPA: lipocalin family protein [Caldimonas sp.]|nr:lipocalin family protein [Caldimonas sp.]
MKLLKILWLCALTSLSAAASAQSAAPLQAIPRLDVPRYLGRWHEIAKFPNWFQRKCVSDTSAEYSLLPEGGLRVVNQCRLENGQMDQAIGVARQIGGDSSARLEVRFAPAWLSFVPFVWGKYWVVDLDDAYQLAAVSEPTREYLWILSRSPVVDETRYAALLGRLTAMGLDVAKLEKTVQRSP